MAFIYGLASTRDGVIKYVGETLDYDTRANHHYRASNNSVACVIIWANRERWLGYDIYSLLIETCRDGERFKRESHWIDRIPGLLNDRKNYSRWQYVRTVDDRAHVHKIQTDGRRNFIENWNGFIGVRYYPRLDAWRVHIQPRQYRHRWLTNTDGGPVTMIGWTRTWRRKTYYVGDDYFADPNNAIGARDIERQSYSYRSQRWPADVDI